MKKVFLSLAALAFVATGTLSVTSCGGSDDKPAPAPAPNPNPDPEPEPDPNPDPDPNPNPTPAPAPSPDSTGKIMYNGQEYNINSTAVHVWGNKQTKQLFRASFISGQDTIPDVTIWEVVSWEGSVDQIQSSPNYVITTIAVPSKAGEQPNTFVPVFPHEAETVYVYSTGLYAGDSQTPVNLGTFTSGEFNMSELTLAQEGQQRGKTKYTASITGSEASFNVTFDGDLYGPIIVAPKTGNSTGNSTQALKVSNKTNVTKINLKHLLKK